jgi:hypothetical protein
MKAMFLLLALLVTLPALSTEATEQCITYEPNTINLYGRITRKVFAGPPNYENVAKGDEAEQVWVLRLNRPVCVAASAQWEAEANVSEIQLVFGEGISQYNRYESLLGKKVVAKGRLFHAHTGHHHTRVLLTVRSIKRLK